MSRIRSNSRDLVYTSVLSASHIKLRIEIRTHVFMKQYIMLVEADLRIGREGVLIADLPQSYPSSRAEATVVMTDTCP